MTIYEMYMTGVIYGTEFGVIYGTEFAVISKHQNSIQVFVRVRTYVVFYLYDIYYLCDVASTWQFILIYLQVESEERMKKKSSSDQRRKIPEK